MSEPGSLSSSERKPCDAKTQYFELPHPVTMVIVIFGLSLLWFCCFYPDAVPYTYLGPLGTLAKYLAYQQPFLLKCIWYGAVLLHVGDSLYSLHLSGSKNLQTSTRVNWFITVFCFGYFSLGKLIAYKPVKD